MLKIILILVIFFYVVYKVGNFFIKVLYPHSTTDQFNRRESNNSNVKFSKKQKRGNSGKDVGEYVDYEEVD